MNQVEWVVRPTVAGAVEEFCRRLEQRLAARSRAEGALPVALTGGNSARAFYEGWRQLYGKTGLDRHAVAFYWSDERIVPPNSPDSNYLLAWQALLEPAEIPAQLVHRVPTEEADPAARYAEIVRRHVPAGPGGVPRFPILILGLGEDGHTASLFPGTDPYAGDAALVRRAAATPAHPHDRVTFTPALINAAREVWFLITGASKARAARALRERAAPPAEVPALIVDPARTAITCFLDAAAGGAEQRPHN